MRFQLRPMLVLVLLSGGAACTSAPAPPARAAAPADVKVPAFPGAEGFGAHAVGGRGGRVYAVTSLQDYPRGGTPIAGTLRAALEAEGPRTVIFRVTGTIELTGALVIRNPFVTIAGQTAPGEGIQIKGHGLIVAAHDVIVRYLRVRPGDEGTKPGDMDGISVSNARDVIIDHCSTAWSTDENLSVTRDSDRITVQWSLAGEGLTPHSMGSLVAGYEGNRISLHHNLYASNSSRNPKVTGWPDEGTPTIDVRNNVIYNWGSTPAYSGRGNEWVRVNFVNNYYKHGPSTEAAQRQVAFRSGSTKTQLYIHGNLLEGFDAGATDNWTLVSNATFGAYKEPSPGVTRLQDPIDAAPVHTDTAAGAFEAVLARAGAVRPRRDAVDARLVDEVRKGTGRIIASQREVGGWPQYPAASAEPDGDGDGMPDAWETTHGLNPRDPADNALDAEGDGYTNLEEWLNGTDPRVAEVHGARTLQASA